MRVEKLPLQSFEDRFRAAVLDVALKKPYTPPSLLPEDAPKPVEAPPPPPTFTEAQMKQAEQEGYRKGFLEGTKEGQMQAQSEQAEVDRKLTEAVAALAKKVEGAIAQGNAFRGEAQEVLPQLAHAVARKVAGCALDVNPLPLVESVIKACLERILGEPHIIITVNDKLSAEMEKRLSAQFSASNDPGEISIEGNAEMAPTDCRIEWDNGKAERNTEEMWKEVAQAIGDMINVNTLREVAAPQTAEPAPAAATETATPEQTQTPQTPTEGV